MIVAWESEPFSTGLIREARTVEIKKITSVRHASFSGTQRWNRLRRFERVWDKFNNLRRHDPEQVIEKIKGSPGGATSNEAAGVRRGLFQHGA